jgi:sec-independent protein translocase protein TatA
MEGLERWLTRACANSYNGMEVPVKGGRMISPPNLLLFGPLGPTELMVVLGIAVLLFGGKKIPEVAKGLGEGIRNFKTALKGEEKVEEKKQA